MKRYQIVTVTMLLCITMMACGGGKTDTEPVDTTSDLSGLEQAELVATALSTDQGGVGKDIENISEPTSLQSQSSAGFSLTISADWYYYDADDQLQTAYDPHATDRIDYESRIRGQLSTAHRYFQELIIDNQSDFMATELLSGTAIIDGTHTNHSSYVRRNAFNNNEVKYNLACDMSARGVAVDLNAGDTFPEAGVIEGTVSGSYVRTASFSSVTKTLYFHFTATYLGDNTAEIELNDGRLFSVHLETGEVDPVD